MSDTKKKLGGIIKILKGGGVGVLPTDTIYGIVGSALIPEAVRRIYKLRRRNQRKPMIVLISSVANLKKFGVRIGVRERKVLNRIWPNKVSVILPLSAKRRALSDKLEYLHRGTKSIAFRLPKSNWLRKLLANVGPLVAPSANWEGKPPARTIREARRYFGKKVDFYIDANRLVSKPSTLVAIKDGRIKVLRMGAARISVK